ncbi:hypothetical protein Bbelb_444490 [Branchiostoma belcheri]|nr:hypothetical protein Bbelb_444490 [Branchiostoma belcheri]
MPDTSGRAGSDGVPSLISGTPSGRSLDTLPTVLGRSGRRFPLRTGRDGAGRAFLQPDQDLKKLQEELQELQTKMAAGDQKIQALEQRPYIERCESGWLEIPYKSLYDGYGSRQHDLTAKFTRPFRKTPVVTLGFVKLDDDSSKNLRVAAEVTTKSTTGLTVRISSSDYRLSVSGYSGTAGDGFDLSSSSSAGYLSGQAFSARDVDRDAFSGNCALFNSGGWWFKKCGYSHLNGPYTRPSDRTTHSGDVHEIGGMAGFELGTSWEGNEPLGLFATYAPLRSSCLTTFPNTEEKYSAVPVVVISVPGSSKDGGGICAPVWLFNLDPDKETREQTGWNVHAFVTLPYGRGGPGLLDIATETKISLSVSCCSGHQPMDTPA